MILFRRRHSLKLGKGLCSVDNVTLNAGAGGEVCATDDVAGVQFQRVKLVDGTADSTAAIPGDATNGLDVDVTRVIPGTTATALGKAEDAAHASTDVGVMALTVRQDTAAALSGTDADYQPIITDGSGRVHVNVGVSALPTGAATAANQSTANSSLATIAGAVAGTEMQVDVLTLPSVTIGAAIPAGANNIGDVDVASVVPGTAATNLGKGEDVAHASGDVGVAMLAVRRDSVAVGSDTDGDYSTLNVNANGRLYTSATVDASLPAGTNNIGDVDVLTVPADPFGLNADAASATGSISAKLRFIASTGIPITGTVTVDTELAAAAALADNTANPTVPAVGAFGMVWDGSTWDRAPGNSAGGAFCQGPIAHDTGIAGNPMRMAGRARTSDYTSVANDDVADIMVTLNGKQVVQQFALPENTWNYAAASGGITNTTGVTARAAGGAGIRNYITGVDVVNGHATVSTDVQIRDGAAGTVLWRGWAQAAGGGVSRTFDPPLRGTANTLVEIANGTTGAATYFNLTGYTGP